MNVALMQNERNIVNFNASDTWTYHALNLNEVFIFVMVTDECLDGNNLGTLSF